jgi:hypothetical protein
MAQELFASADPFGGGAQIGKSARGSLGSGVGSSSYGSGGGGGSSGGAASPDRRLWFLALHVSGPQDPPAATDSGKMAAAAASLGESR